MTKTVFLLRLALPLMAAETAVMTDGTRIAAERHENNGEMIRLFTEEGVRDVAVEEITHFAPPDPVIEPPPEMPPQPPALPDAKPARRKALTPHELARAMALKHRLPAAMVQSIIAAESGFKAGALSGKGAVGLMQIMPATAAMFGLDASDPEQNVDAGARYLRFLVDRYRKYRDWPRRVIAAYNAGPAAVDRYKGVPPYPETQSYVARVLLLIKQFERDPA